MSLSERQIEIIEVATKLIGDKGIQNLTTKSLAAEIGFSEPALYRHFENKTAILKAVIDYYKEKMREGASETIFSNAKAIDKLFKILELQFDYLSNNPAIVMVVFAETSFQNDSVLSEAVCGVLNQKRKMMTLLMKTGQMEGMIKKDIEPDQLATVFMGSMRMTILRWRLNGFKLDLKEEGKRLKETLNLLIRT